MNKYWTYVYINTLTNEKAWTEISYEDYLLYKNAGFLVAEGKNNA